MITSEIFHKGFELKLNLKSSLNFVLASLREYYWLVKRWNIKRIVILKIFRKLSDSFFIIFIYIQCQVNKFSCLVSLNPHDLDKKVRIITQIWKTSIIRQYFHQKCLFSHVFFICITLLLNYFVIVTSWSISKHLAMLWIHCILEQFTIFLINFLYVQIYKRL